MSAESDRIRAEHDQTMNLVAHPVIAPTDADICDDCGGDGRAHVRYGAEILDIDDQPCLTCQGRGWLR